MLLVAFLAVTEKTPAGSKRSRRLDVNVSVVEETIVGSQFHSKATEISDVQ